MARAGKKKTKKRVSSVGRVAEAGVSYGEGLVGDEGFADSGEALLREVSYRLEIPVERLGVAMAAARLGPEPFGIVETLVELGEGEQGERLARVAAAVTEVLERAMARPGDPLAAVDEAGEAEVLRGELEAEIEVKERRQALLTQCIGVEEVARRVGRSRQGLERRRREGRLLALRVRSRWRYPVWQLDPDAPGGVVPGLAEVLANLRLTPAGAATWLTGPMEALCGRRPIELLRAGQAAQVIALAEAHGHLP